MTKAKKLLKEFFLIRKDEIITYTAFAVVAFLIFSPVLFCGASIELALGDAPKICFAIIAITFLGTLLFCIAGIYLLCFQASQRLLKKAEKKKIRNPEKKIRIFLISLAICEAIFLFVLLKNAVELYCIGAYRPAGGFFFGFFALSFLFFCMGITEELS